jgi:hypothetical protein
MRNKTHRLPAGLRAALDLQTPPPDPWHAYRYRELASLLEQMGERLDLGDISPFQLRDWEANVLNNLRGPEIDEFMAAPAEEEFDASLLPEQRYRNLRNVLLARKGLGSWAPK